MKSREVAITWQFGEPPARIWDAWTQPALMRKWFGSDPQGRVTGARADPRVGGSFEVTFVNSDGSSYTCFGTYREVQPVTRLVFSWSWKDNPTVSELVTIVLAPEGTGTGMKFVHADIHPLTTHDYAAGWKTTFEKLARALVSRTP